MSVIGLADRMRIQETPQVIARRFEGFLEVMDECRPSLGNYRPHEHNQCNNFCYDLNVDPESEALIKAWNNLHQLAEHTSTQRKVLPLRSVTIIDAQETVLKSVSTECFRPVI